MRTAHRPRARRAALTALALAWAAGIAHAHAILTKASLDVTAVKPHTATTVTLTFNAAVEGRLTKVVLVGATGAHTPLAVKAGRSPAEVAVALPPLATGAYGLRYTVLAADGHLTENLLRFRVAPAD